MKSARCVVLGRRSTLALERSEREREIERQGAIERERERDGEIKRARAIERERERDARRGVAAVPCR